MSGSSENSWLSILKQAEKSCIIENGMRKVHYKFPRGEEMVEEYNMETDVINRRLWKNINKFGGEVSWEAEIGEPEKTPTKSFDVTGIVESSSNPFVVRRSTKNILEWRIRNLTYPLSTYSVTACLEDKSIVVRTSNKKFFKVLKIPELDRLGLLPEQNMIEYTHKFNTLIISTSRDTNVVSSMVVHMLGCMHMIVEKQAVMCSVQLRFNLDDKLKNTVEDWPLSQPQKFWEHGNLQLMTLWDSFAKYQKPPQLIAFEAEVMKELKKIQATEKGKMPCNPS